MTLDEYNEITDSILKEPYKTVEPNLDLASLAWLQNEISKFEQRIRGTIYMQFGAKDQKVLEALDEIRDLELELKHEVERRIKK